MNTKFRKKPVVIDAWQYHPFKSFDDVPEFIRDGNQLEQFGLRNEKEGLYIKTIQTLEGVHHVTDGDYIIRGVNGEYYPCKPDIFEKTYGEVIENA